MTRTVKEENCFFIIVLAERLAFPKLSISTLQPVSWKLSKKCRVKKCWNTWVLFQMKIIVLLRSIVLVRGHMFITVSHERYFISWIFRAVPSFLALFLIINIYAIFYLNTIMALHFLWLSFPLQKGKEKWAFEHSMLSVYLKFKFEPIDSFPWTLIALCYRM